MANGNENNNETLDNIQEEDANTAYWVALLLAYDARIFAERFAQQIEFLRASGVREQQLAGILMSDLVSEGRIFGEFKNAIKRGIVTGINQASRRPRDTRGNLVYRWIVAQGVENCSDCIPRQGLLNTYEGWTAEGLPGTGWSICRGWCYCQLVPENIDIDENIKI